MFNTFNPSEIEGVDYRYICYMIILYYINLLYVVGDARSWDVCAAFASTFGRGDLHPDVSEAQLRRGR